MDNSIDCCVTSPPYWGLRDYGVTGQIGLENTMQEYIDKTLEVFEEVKRVLKPQGTLWLNLGDSYVGTGGDRQPVDGNGPFETITRLSPNNGRWARNAKSVLKPKQLVGIPWKVAFALQENGWYLRSDIIWAKPNPMPESVKDRPTKSHEYIFLMTKSQKYYYDCDSIKEPVIDIDSNTPQDIERAMMRRRKAAPKGNARIFRGGAYCNNSTFNNCEGGRRTVSGNLDRKYGDERNRPGSQLGASVPWEGTMKNKRDVWIVASQPCKEAHFATFPPKLIEPCILAGCPAGGIVLDPFMGSGTTAMVSIQLQRNFIGFELNPEYIKIAERRISNVQIKIV